MRICMRVCVCVCVCMYCERERERERERESDRGGKAGVIFDDVKANYEIHVRLITKINNYIYPLITIDLQITNTAPPSSFCH